MLDEAEPSGASRVRRRCRRWGETRERRIVAKSNQLGVSVSVVGRRHDVNANQVFQRDSVGVIAKAGDVGLHTVLYLRPR